MIFWRYDNSLRKYHGLRYTVLNNQNSFFFGLTKHVFIQISSIKNNQVDLIIDYILV